VVVPSGGTLTLAAVRVGDTFAPLSLNVRNTASSSDAFSAETERLGSEWKRDGYGESSCAGFAPKCRVIGVGSGGNDGYGGGQNGECGGKFPDGWNGNEWFVGTDRGERDSQFDW